MRDLDVLDGHLILYSSCIVLSLADRPGIRDSDSGDAVPMGYISSVFAFEIHSQDARSCLVQESQSSRTFCQKATDLDSLALAFGTCCDWSLDIRRD